MNVIELIIDEKDVQSGIDAVSVVESPAIEENFVALSKHEVELKEVDKEKRILMGAALIPNKLIYRKSGDQEFYIFFSKETIRQVSEAYLKRGNQSEATLEHEIKLQGLTIVESWIVEELGGDYDEWVKNLEHIDQPNCGIENPDDCEACGS